MSAETGIVLTRLQAVEWMDGGWLHAVLWDASFTGAVAVLTNP